ncbi:uncharacterized protein LOC114290348 [Camellia sinensis]|uniref:uncharacterized protein LOC114290348 n=1 Tax=Camellia sinensis TaxID=4442 RepID=UPI001035BEA0|nr:uncharacterized protein LOC114290348 [Camellia sinensis]
MKDMEFLKDYFSRVMELVTQMKIYGDNITNQRVVEKILISLLEKYNPIVVIIEETKDLADLSIEDLMCSIKTFEQRLSRQSEKSIESVFQSKLNVSTSNSQGRGRGGGRNVTGRARNARGRGRSNFQRKENEESTQQKCGICNRSNHVDKDCWFRRKPKCYNCNIFGHVKKDCHAKSTQQANFSKEQESEEHMFYACHKDVWFLDNGCSNHMIGDESNFCENGCFLQFSIPDLEQNLLSVGQLMGHGYLVHFEDDFCKNFDKGGKSQVVAKINMEKNRSFPLIFRYSKNAALKIDVIDNSWLWHRRFGHLNFQNLKHLQ